MYVCVSMYVCVYVCMCVYMCVYICVCVLTHMWGPEANVDYLPQWIPTVFLES